MLILAWALHPANLYRVACGASTVAADPQGNLWAPDSAMTPGGSVWGSLIPEPVPYNHLRYSNPALSPMTYSFQVPAGTYTVTLKFTEPSRMAAGSRVFNVTINGTVASLNLDLFAQAGKAKPYDVISNVTMPTAGPIGIVLQSSVSNSVISGIQIDDVPPPSPSPFVQPSLYSSVYGGIPQETLEAEDCLTGIPVPYTAFQSANPFTAVPLLTVADNWSPRSIQLEETTTFTSNSPQVTQLSASIGTLQQPAWYTTPPLVLMKPAPNFISYTGIDPAQITSHTLYLTVSVINVNPGPLSSLTAGSLTAKVCGISMSTGVFSAPVALFSLAGDSSIAAGSTGNLTLNLANADPGRPDVSAFQATLIAPAGVSITPAIGPVATTAGKTLQCNALVCVVSGLNSTTMQNGVAISYAVSVPVGMPAVPFALTAVISASGAGGQLPVAVGPTFMVTVSPPLGPVLIGSLDPATKLCQPQTGPFTLVDGSLPDANGVYHAPGHMQSPPMANCILP